MALRRVPDRAARKAPAPAKRPWWLIAVGLAAVLVMALVTLPAKIVAGQLARIGIEAVGFSGSVWNGRAHGLAWRSAPLGDLQWSIAPLELLRGRVGGELELARPDGSLATQFSVSLGGDLHLSGTQFTLPVAALAALPVGMPRNWHGRVSGKFTQVQVSHGWPAAVRGTLDMDGLIAPPPRNTSIGSYHIEIPDPQATDSAEGALQARVTDKEGPFSFEGRFTLTPDRNFLLEGTLAPRGTTPPALVRSIELLGPPDANGRRSVSVSGTL
jgi:hypothetical protein